MNHDLFLEEARLGPRNPVLVAYDEAPHLAKTRHRFREFALVDLAHTVMMIEADILSPESGARPLAGLLEILELGEERFPWDPRSGCYLVQTENYLSEHIDPDIAGRLQTGRSRNDQYAAADRVFLRDALLAVTGDVMALQRAVLEHAGAHVRTVMPGYTHFQHAQPWTFGHYLMRQASHFERDLERLEGAFGRTNMSALGGAANAGTSWPLDRQRASALLGHEGIVVNSSDCGAFSRDYVEEDVACLAIMMGNLGRLATDLYVWHSWEFGFIEIEDGLAGTSSIMPQKKNPHVLERVKGIAGQAIGWLPSVMGCQRGVLSTDLDLEFGDDLLTPIREGCTGSLRLMTETMRTLTVHADVMAEKAGAFWSTASNLADELVRRYDLSFRAAHQIVGRFIRDSLAAGHEPRDASPPLLAKAAEALAGPPVELTEAELRSILDAGHFVESRVTEGSVNPDRVRAHIDLANQALEAHTRWHAEKTAMVERAAEELIERARRLAAGSGA